MMGEECEEDKRTTSEVYGKSNMEELAEGREWYDRYDFCPLDSMAKAQESLRFSNGTPTVHERLAMLERSRAFIEDMAAPGFADFDFQRCDPNHHNEAFLILNKVSINNHYGGQVSISFGNYY